MLKDTKGCTIINIDNENDYYDVRLKEYRLKELESLSSAISHQTSYIYIKGDIADKQTIDGIFEEYKPQVVVNLAAQAGVRYSIENPDAYIQSNMIGFYNILEACRHSMDEGRCKKEDERWLMEDGRWKMEGGNDQPSTINHQTYQEGAVLDG